MLNFVRNIFRTFFSVLLWIILISFTLGGFLGVGSAYNDFGWSLVGLLVGFLVGALNVIIFGGLIATLMSIDENTKKIYEKLCDKQSQSGA